jgi:hypothetical protein
MVIQAADSQGVLTSVIVAAPSRPVNIISWHRLSMLLPYQTHVDTNIFGAHLFCLQAAKHPAVRRSRVPRPLLAALLLCLQLSRCAPTVARLATWQVH